MNKNNPKGYSKALKSGAYETLEYEMRLIDVNGDAFDVHFGETPEEVKTHGALGDHDGEAVAYVIEKHIRFDPAHLTPAGREPDEYETLETAGDKAALVAGGWVKGEASQ